MCWDYKCLSMCQAKSGYSESAVLPGISIPGRMILGGPLVLCEMKSLDDRVSKVLFKPVAELERQSREKHPGV